MRTITRKIEFDYAHRILGHESKCASLHGHRGTAEITVSSPELDTLGRVVDFSAIKGLIGRWIDDFWDHTILLHPDDPLLKCPSSVFGKKPPYIMTLGNPTAENIAQELHHQTSRFLPPPLKVVRIRFWETPSCYADYIPE